MSVACSPYKFRSTTTLNKNNSETDLLGFEPEEESGSEQTNTLPVDLLQSEIINPPVLNPLQPSTTIKMDVSNLLQLIPAYEISPADYISKCY